MSEKGPIVAKVLHLRVSVGTEDKRTMAEFEEDVRHALSSDTMSGQDDARVKNLTVVGAEYIIDGQRVSVEDWENPQPEKPKKPQAKKARDRSGRQDPHDAAEAQRLKHTETPAQPDGPPIPVGEEARKILTGKDKA